MYDKTEENDTLMRIRRCGVPWIEIIGDLTISELHWIMQLIKFPKFKLIIFMINLEGYFYNFKTEPFIGGTKILLCLSTAVSNSARYRLVHLAMSSVLWISCDLDGWGKQENHLVQRPTNLGCFACSCLSYIGAGHSFEMVFD